MTLYYFSLTINVIHCKKGTQHLTDNLITTTASSLYFDDNPSIGVFCYYWCLIISLIKTCMLCNIKYERTYRNETSSSINSSLLILASSHDTQTFRWVLVSYWGIQYIFISRIIILLSFIASIYLIKEVTWKKSAGEKCNRWLFCISLHIRYCILR